MVSLISGHIRIGELAELLGDAGAAIAGRWSSLVQNNADPLRGGGSPLRGASPYLTTGPNVFTVELMLH